MAGRRDLGTAAAEAQQAADAGGARSRLAELGAKGTNQVLLSLCLITLPVEKCFIALESERAYYP